MKIECTFANLAYEQSLFYGMLFGEDKGHSWRETLFKALPKTKELFNRINDGDETERNKEIRNFMIDFYKKNFIDIIDTMNLMQGELDKITKELWEAIAHTLNFKTKKDPTVEVGLSIVPIGTRDWRNNKITVMFWLDPKEFIEVTMHELIHVFYFKKLKQMFPDIDESTFEPAYDNWLVSEVLCPILQNNPRISKIVGESSICSYACNEETSREINELYIRCLKENMPFEEFYERARDIILNNKHGGK